MILSLPEALLASLENTEGFDRQSFVDAHAYPKSITSIRYNPIKLPLLKDKLPAKPIPWNPYGYYLPSRPSFTLDPLFHAGLYYVQEAGSQFLWQVLSQNISREEPVKVLDLCAAPGGKSTLLASYFSNGLIVANETIKSRVNVLTENTTKWGSGNIVVTNNDPAHFNRLPGHFDVVLIDAPCSGSGLFRRDNEAIAEWSEDNVLLCGRRQQRILSDAFSTLKKGGLLIYSTCSYSPQEDENQLDWLAENFKVENIPIQTDARWGITEVRSNKHQQVGYKFYPNKTDSEGFFIALFKKTETTNTGYAEQGNLISASRAEFEEVFKWISSKEAHYVIKQNENLVAVNQKWREEIAVLQKNLYLKKVGISIGAIKNKGLVPAHDLAVSMLLTEEINKMELSEDESLQYLRRKEINSSEVTKGWIVATFKGLNLGWMKILPNRVNNYYPTEWRILKD